MKILLTGAEGQLGRELQFTLPANINLLPLSRQQLDITEATEVHKVVAEFQPDCIINAAAFSAVDAAESNTTLAYAVNAEGVLHLAQAAFIHGTRLIHISTDYVFDGTKNNLYLPNDLPNPINHYGKSKWEGEKQVQTIIPEQSVVIRTSWVYSSYGKNFVKTILETLEQRSELSMVIDQISSPTWARILALAIWQVVERKHLRGIYHWTDGGVLNKYEFTKAIQEMALNMQLLSKKIPIHPIKSIEYASAAVRPLHTALDISSSIKDFDFQPFHWHEALQKMLQELKHVA